MVSWWSYSSVFTGSSFDKFSLTITFFCFYRFINSHDQLMISILCFMGYSFGMVNLWSHSSNLWCPHSIWSQLVNSFFCFVASLFDMKSIGDLFLRFLPGTYLSLSELVISFLGFYWELMWHEVSWWSHSYDFMGF